MAITNLIDMPWLPVRYLDGTSKDRDPDCHAGCGKDSGIAVTGVSE